MYEQPLSTNGPVSYTHLEISTQKEHNPTSSLPLQHQLSLNEIDKKELKILIAEDNESNYSLVQHMEGSMTERQIDKEMSERMGHHRNDIKKFYSEFLEDS